MGDPSLAVRDGRSREPSARESALDAFTLADPCGGCGVSVVRQGPRARFRRAAIASVALCPHGQRDPLRPRLQRHAPRLGGFINPGGFPGRRVATRIRAAAASPFGLSEPASGQEWPVVPGAGRLPARHRDFCDSGTGLRLSAPTSASADHAAGGSSVDGGILPPRHESLTSKILITILAAIGPKADFGACHYPVRTDPHPHRLPGSDRRNRAKPGREPSQLAQIPVDHATPSPQVRLRQYARDPLSPLPVPVCQTCSRVKGGPPQHPPGRLRP